MIDIVYDLTKDEDLKEWNDLQDKEIEELNDIKGITIVQPESVLIGLIFTANATVIFDGADMAESKQQETLYAWQALRESGKIACEVTETSDLMFELKFAKDSIVYFEAYKGILTMDDFYRAGVQVKEIFGLKDSITVVDDKEIQNIEQVESKDKAKITKALNKVADGQNLVLPESDTPKTDGLVNIPEKYRAQAQTVVNVLDYIATATSGVPYASQVIASIHYLFDKKIIEISDDEREDFITVAKRVAGL